jgi:hypothetical protein
MVTEQMVFRSVLNWEASCDDITFPEVSWSNILSQVLLLPRLFVPFGKYICDLIGQMIQLQYQSNLKSLSQNMES